MKKLFLPVSARLLLSAILLLPSLGSCKKEAEEPQSVVSVDFQLGFYPKAAGVGTTITLIGHNFSEVAANNRVSFGSVEATAFLVRKHSQLDSIQVLVPPGAESGPLTLRVLMQATRTDSSFLVTPSRWTQKANFPGVQSSLCTSFSAGGKGYLRMMTNEL
jgi:hypothetical protein